VTIRDDCDLGTELESIESLSVQPQDVETLRELLRGSLGEQTP